MDRLIAYVMVAASAWVLPNTTAAWIPFENEVTVYMLSCDGEQVSDVCHGKEKTDIPFTYRVLLDQRSVWYWRTDDPSKPRRFPRCTIHDAKSWLCQLESDEVPKSRFGMVAGKYVEIATCVTGATTPFFYQVPMWRWWLVRLHEKLS
ncbi:hypothetical protein ACKI2N_023580 [Cupriavidus sp. 30B13]|uniref:hypothetical protein n=1 Tax=Cupriavidus sp. 30B13 TaxID=3384241 RepID=UPI003B92129E